ncbi:MAG TPA: CAP domain-containing protein [Polyangiaceae bacterium]|nr:CAP domain-containing protein [Polyangiaceae bacterium]
MTHLPTRISALTLLSLCVACEARAGSGPAYISEAGPVSRPAGPLDQKQAEQYVLALVNHDRKDAGLSPVAWDETAAVAGRRHADDMAHHGYTAHWGTDGSVPEQRYTEAGGTHLSFENAACFFDGTARELEHAARYDAVELEKIETAFMAETPPNDGHRQNILKPHHTKFGVGLSLPVGLKQPCMSQEFVDDYGTYAALPRRVHVGQTVTVQGEVAAPVKFAAVGIARIDRATPLTVEHLNKTYTYPMPAPFVLYSPPGFKTPKPVKLDGNRFTIDVPLSDHGQAGRYEVSIWGTFPGSSALGMVSLRVVDAE